MSFPFHVQFTGLHICANFLLTFVWSLRFIPRLLQSGYYVSLSYCLTGGSIFYNLHVLVKCACLKGSPPYICVHIHARVCVCVYMYVCMYVCMYVRTCVCTCYFSRDTRAIEKMAFKTRKEDRILSFLEPNCFNQ